MMFSRRRVLTLGVGLSAVVIVLASAAWACTFVPRVFSINPLAGPRSTEVTVSGQGVSRRGAVEIRWNAVNGPKVAETKADDEGAFRTAVRVPDAVPGVYTLVVVDQNTGVARASFELTPEAGVPSLPTVDSAPTGSARSAWSIPLGEENELSPARRGSSPGLAVGAALLSIGGAVLFSGFVTALVRRRRAAAPPS